MANVILIGAAPSTFTRAARITLHEKKVDYRLDPVEFATIGTPAFREHHPFNKIPVLRHGDAHVYETEAICRYIDEAFPGPSFQPATPLERARMTQWISVTNSYFYKSMILDTVIERLVAPRLFGRQADEARVAAAQPIVAHQFGVLEAALSRTPYLASTTPSIADFVLTPIIAYMGAVPEGQKLLAKSPKLAAWQERMASRQSFKDTMPN